MWAEDKGENEKITHEPNKKRKIGNRSRDKSPIPIQNRFGIFENSEEEAEAEMEQEEQPLQAKKMKIPPIVVTGRTNQPTKFLGEINSTTTTKKSTGKYTSNGFTIYADNTESYNLIKENLDQQKISYYTYASLRKNRST